jgi:hypothetical protein
MPSALKGHATVLFDGVDDALGRANPSALPAGAADRTAFMVVRYTTEGWGGFAWGTHQCNRAFGLVVSEEANNVGRFAAQGWCNDYKTATNATGTGWHRHAAVLQAGSVRQFVDGALVLTNPATAFNTGNARMRLGVELNDNREVGMEVAEILVYNRALSEAELQQVEGYFGTRYF